MAVSSLDLMEAVNCYERSRQMRVYLEEESIRRMSCSLIKEDREFLDRYLKGELFKENK